MDFKDLPRPLLSSYVPECPITVVRQTESAQDTLSTLPISYTSLLSRALNHMTQFDHRITLLDSRKRKGLALRKALDHSNLDTLTEDTSIPHLEAVLETKFKDFIKGRGAPWRRDNNAGEAALELLIQVCGVPMQWSGQSNATSGSPVRVSYL